MDGLQRRAGLSSGMSMHLCNAGRLNAGSTIFISGVSLLNEHCAPVLHLFSLRRPVAVGWREASQISLRGIGGVSMRSEGIAERDCRGDALPW